MLEEKDYPCLYKKVNGLVDRIRTKGLFQWGDSCDYAGCKVRIYGSEKEELLKESIKYYGISESYYRIENPAKKRFIEIASQALEELKIPGRILQKSDIEDLIHNNERFRKKEVTGEDDLFLYRAIMEIPQNLIAQEGISKKYVREYMLGCRRGIYIFGDFTEWALSPDHHNWDPEDYFSTNSFHIWKIRNQEELTQRGLDYLIDMFQASAKNLPKHNKVSQEEINQFLGELDNLREQRFGKA